MYVCAVNVRTEAGEILNRWERGGVFAETLVEDSAHKGKFSSADRAFLNALVMGVLRNRTWLDHVIDSLRTGGHLQYEIRMILRLGMCQLLILDLAPHAAVNETVALAPRKASGLVNALLRRAIRDNDSIREEWKTLPLHVRYSTPQWLVSRWIDAFGENTTLALLARQQLVPSLFARRNPSVPLQDGLVPEGMEESPDLPGWYRVKGKLPLELLREGAFYITDPSTRYAIDLLSPEAGESILDACAAPGGKTAAISSITEGKARILATDSAVHRLPRLRQNLEKWSNQSIEVAGYDWTEPCPRDWKGRFDGVLADVPCSNTGVMQRRVDVRWRLTAREIERLCALQEKIIHNVSGAVSPGGRLVYSTCSIDPAEDGLLVRKFLGTHPGWKLDKEVLVLPLEEESDGAYAARLVRI